MAKPCPGILRFALPATVISAFGAAEPVAAKPTTPESEIVVTARRLAERQAEVPLSVTVFRADDISASAIDSLQSLAAHTPGLAFTSIWGGANSFPVLRGQSQPSVAGDAVGMFVDGVYQANRDALDVEMLDITRIEVVKGPQSALFGHSSFSGLIHYVPAAASERWIEGGTVEVGTDSLAHVSAMVSGPLDEQFKIRLAASWRSEDGTWSTGVTGQRPGGSERSALAGTLATRDDAGPLSLRLSARYGSNRFDQPAMFTIDGSRFNCGSRDARSGLWSYFCGTAPLSGPAALTAGLPSSRSWTAQAALHATLDLGAVELHSDTSWYQSGASIVRDFDGSAIGDLYGVCAIGVNCGASAGQILPVLRLLGIDIIQVHPMRVREIGQELRLASAGSENMRWSLGGAVFWTQQGQRTNFAYGAARGDLAPTERLTAPVPGDLLRVGPVAAINAALVSDPAAAQVTQNDAIEDRRTFALFGTVEGRLAPTVRLRGELRANWERLVLDSRWSNFAASFGTALGPHRFFDVTPRLGLDWQPSPGWLLHVSHARGSRSGGINAVAGLLPREQTFEPETNWTTELGAHYTGSGLLASFELTGYHIDWRNAQILGLSATPGITALITRNTRGVETWGVDFAATLRPRPWLGLEFALGYAHPRFKPGSEDPGSSAFCGLTANVATSSFCTITASKINAGQPVPDVSGKMLPQAPELTGAGALVLAPRDPRFRGLRLRLGFTYQGEMFERAVNGLSYGRRTLFDARMSLPLGRFALELWGTNLANTRYARVAVGRQPQFYPTLPRPTDLILGDGRRLGLTLRLPE